MHTFIIWFQYPYDVLLQLKGVPIRLLLCPPGNVRVTFDHLLGFCGNPLLFRLKLRIDAVRLHFAALRRLPGAWLRFFLFLALPGVWLTLLLGTLTAGNAGRKNDQD